MYVEGWLYQGNTLLAFVHTDSTKWFAYATVIKPQFRNQWWPKNNRYYNDPPLSPKNLNGCGGRQPFNIIIFLQGLKAGTHSTNISVYSSLSGFCQMGMLESQQPISIELAHAANGCKF